MNTLPSDWKHFAFIVAGIGALCLSAVPALSGIATELVGIGGGLIGWGGLKRPGDAVPERAP